MVAEFPALFFLTAGWPTACVVASSFAHHTWNTNYRRDPCAVILARTATYLLSTSFFCRVVGGCGLGYRGKLRVTRMYDRTQKYFLDVIPKTAHVARLSSRWVSGPPCTRPYDEYFITVHVLMHTLQTPQEVLCGSVVLEANDPKTAVAR